MSSQRKRVTITIRNDLLNGLDRLVDHQRIRNRSHAIEFLLTRVLQNKPAQAVILASGAGTHMRPFTYEIPKPLIPVNGRPLLEHSLALLREAGITNVIITVSHLAEKIEQHFGNGHKFGVSITYAREPKPSGTGGALLAARKFLSDNPFVVVYGDVLAKLDVSDLLHLHRDTKAAVATMAITSVADPSAYGAVRLRGARVVNFSEKPGGSADVSRFVFAGITAMSPSVFSFFPKRRGKALSLEHDVFPKLISEGRLFGYPFEGQWFDVSTPEVYERALQRWQD